MMTITVGALLVYGFYFVTRSVIFPYDEKTIWANQCTAMLLFTSFYWAGVLSQRTSFSDDLGKTMLFVAVPMLILLNFYLKRNGK